MHKYNKKKNNLKEYVWYKDERLDRVTMNTIKFILANLTARYIMG